MSKGSYESRQRVATRIGRLIRRAKTIRELYHIKDTQLAEASALEWAIPILEKYAADKFGEPLNIRRLYFKHEQQDLVYQLAQRDGIICYLCDKAIKEGEESVDHIIPVAKGGKDIFSNYRLAHITCNTKKGDKLLSKEV